MLESTILEHLRTRGPGWVTSKEIAVEIGFPWRAVARAMLRMPELDKEPQYWVSARYRTRKRMTFRYVAPPVAVYPAWLLPQMPINSLRG